MKYGREQIDDLAENMDIFDYPYIDGRSIKIFKGSTQTDGSDIRTVAVDREQLYTTNSWELMPKAYIGGGKTNWFYGLEKNLREYSHGAFMGAASASSERRPNKLKGVIGFYGIKNAELGAELLRHVAMELFARGCRNVAANTVSWDYEEEKDTILSVLREAGFGSQLGYDIMSNDTKTSPRQITAVLPDRECLGQLRSSPDLKFKKEFLEKLVRG